MFRFLRESKLFSNLKNKELALFLPYIYQRSYHESEVIFFRGDPSHALYLVASGEISLNIDVKDKFEKLTSISKGEAFGDNCLLTETIRIYTSIVESEKANLYVVPQFNIHEIFKSHVEIKAKILENFATWYNSYTVSLFKSYKESFGFFNLGDVYDVNH
jgi:CRP-like cAMP-binding protein